MREEIHHLHRYPSMHPCFHGALAGYSWCDGSYRISRNNDITWVIEYIVKGRGTLRIGESIFHPQAGDVYIVPAMSDHEYYADASDPWEKIWFNCTGSLLKSVLSEYEVLGIHHFQNCFSVFPHFESGVDLVRQDPIKAQLELPHIFHRIISALSQIHRQFQRRPASSQRLLAEKIKHHLEVHLVSDLSLQDIAERHHKSVSQVIRIFKQTWGITPHQYILTQRIEESKLLLLRTVSTLKSIADELGFKDEYHFANTFKAKVGIAPGAFRKNPKT